MSDISLLIPIVAALLGASAGALLTAKFNARRSSRERQLAARIDSAKANLEKNRADREACERLGQDLADWYNALSDALQEGIGDSETLIRFNERINFERRIEVQTAKLRGETLYAELIKRAAKFREVAIEEKTYWIMEAGFDDAARGRLLGWLKRDYQDFQDELIKVIEQLNQRDYQLRRVQESVS
jgi:hypothetical protein